MEGMTKKEYSAWMHRLLNPLKCLYSRGRARLHLGETGVTYSADVAEMEGFSRPLWALVPFWNGGGRDPEFEEIYRWGLVHGTDPCHPEYWGDFGDYDQRFVEMAAIACGLLFAPEQVWEPLREKEKENLARWLSGINQHTLPECNWQFFRILVNIALKKRGFSYDAQKLEESLEKIESYYIGDGWYRDGSSSQKDYYISFAFHYYGLLYAVAMNDEEPERCAVFRERAERFAQDFLHWFAPDGSALPYGRSLAYRFGQAAFWSAYVFAGLTGISLGVVKGILARHLNWWDRQKMTDRDGVLTIGYSYPNLIMAERYNSPGSPYWGAKTLLVLALPDDHPFWQEQPLPFPEVDPLWAIPEADMLVQHFPNETVAYPAGVCERYGHGHVPEKYAKFAYSTRFGFSCARSQLVLHENFPDSMLAFVIDGSDMVFVRESSLSWKVQEDCVETVWSPFPEIEVESKIMPCVTGHRRVHRIHTALACEAYDCGFAVQKFVPGFRTETRGNSALVENDSSFCSVHGSGEGCLIGADPNTNVLYPNSEIPAIRYRLTPGSFVLETEIRTQS